MTKLWLPPETSGRALSPILRYLKGDTGLKKRGHLKKKEEEGRKKKGKGKKKEKEKGLISMRLRYQRDRGWFREQTCQGLRSSEVRTIHRTGKCPAGTRDPLGSKGSPLAFNMNSSRTPS